MSGPDRTVLDSYTFQNADEVYGADLGEVLSAHEWKVLLGVQNRLPCVVTELVDENYVIVQPTIKLVFSKKDENGNYQTADRPVLKVQIKREFAGGVGIYLPISVGDTGWIEGADRDTQTYKSQDDLTNPVRPLTLSSGQYRFGYFVPDTIQKTFTIATDDAGCLCLQTLDGTVKIVIDPTTKQVRVKSPASVDVETPVVNITGNLVVTGTITSQTQIISPKVQAAGVNMEVHRHAPSTVPPTNP